MPGAKCCVENCKPPKGTMFHRFPKDVELFKLWCEALGRPNLLPRKSLSVCDLHFDEDSKFIMNRNRTNLKFGSIPSVNLPGRRRDEGAQLCQPQVQEVIPPTTNYTAPTLSTSRGLPHVHPINLPGPAEETILIIVEARNENGSESDATVVELSTNYATTTSNFEEDKAKLLKKLAQLSQRVALMTHPSELDVINECIAPIESKLATLNISGRAEC